MVVMPAFVLYSSFQFPRDYERDKEGRVWTGSVFITFSFFDISGRVKWTPSWTPKWTMWHGRNRSNVMFLFVSPSPSDIPWENMNRDFAFFLGGDWVQRPFNQRFGQEAHDHLDATVKTVCDMVSSLRFDVDAHHHKAGWAANMGSIVVVRRSTKDVVCLFMLLAVQMCMITLPPVIHGKWKMGSWQMCLVFKWAIFHFHDYGRKGILFVSPFIVCESFSYDSKDIHLVQKSKPQIMLVMSLNKALQVAIMHWFVQPSGEWDSGHGTPWHHSGWDELAGNIGRYGGAVRPWFQSAPMCFVGSRCWCVRSLQDDLIMTHDSWLIMHDWYRHVDSTKLYLELYIRRFLLSSHVQWTLIPIGQSHEAIEIPQQESKAKISDTDRAVNALNGRIVAWNVFGGSCPSILGGAKHETDNCWKFTRESNIVWSKCVNPSCCCTHESNIKLKMKTIMFLNLSAAPFQRVWWWVESKWCKNLGKLLGNLSRGQMVVTIREFRQNPGHLKGWNSTNSSTLMCNSLLMFVSTEQTRTHAHIHMRTQNDGFQPLQFSTHGEHASKPTCGDV